MTMFCYHFCLIYIIAGYGAENRILQLNMLSKSKDKNEIYMTYFFLERHDFVAEKMLFL